MAYCRSYVVEVPGGRAEVGEAGTTAAVTPASRITARTQPPSLSVCVRVACACPRPVGAHEAFLASPGLDPGSGRGWRLAQAGPGVGRRHTTGCSRPQSTIVKAQ